MNRYEFEEDPSVGSWRNQFGVKRNAERANSVDFGIEFHTTTNGPSDPFERAVDDILGELREVMLRKHADYGPLNIALAPGGAINGLRVRMHDKLARINNLHESGKEPNNESMQDSWLDLANYGIIGLMVLRGQWPGTTE